MKRPQEPILLAPSPVEKGRFTGWGLLAAIGGAVLFGVVWGWLAQMAGSYFAPLVIFPILVGVFVGLSIVGLIRAARIGHRPTIFLAAALAATTAAGGEHYFGYLAYYEAGSQIKANSATGADLSALVHETTPGFGRYLRAQADRGRPLLTGYVAHGWVVWLSWAIEGLLMVATAVVIVIPAVQVPYCNRCGTWYRTVRSGRIGLTIAQRLGELIGAEDIDHPRSARYRLSACQSGCGPTRCELSWEGSDGAGWLVRAWLDPAARNQVATIIDGLETPTSNL